jgi:PAS domain S-box-containing protein
MPPRRAQKEPPPRLLVVDDNALNRDMLSRRLRRREYEVLVAEDGETALEMLKTERIDLVLLDWMMPGLSGIDVLARIRATTSQVELPVIMATAKTEADDIVEALKAEANDYVTKPLNFDVVHARIRTQLNLARAHRELVASERRFRALLENTGDMIVQYEPDGHVHYVSPASRILLGWEADALKKRSFYDWMHPIDRRALEEQQQTSLPPAFTFIARMQRQDATYIWVETSCRVLREAGQVLVQAACRDVTEHMESLSGDEPPLPLGGDIMAHPGWRGSSGMPAPEREAAPSIGPSAGLPVPSAPAPPPVSEPVVPVVVVTAAGAEELQQLLESGALVGGASGLSGAVEERLLQWLARRADEGSSGG